MPNVITGHNNVLILLGATNGGWCVYAGTHDKTASEILEASPAAGIADDEGLIEWFADQLALPAPELQAHPPQTHGPVAKPAEHGAPPVEGGDQIKHMVDRFLSWPVPVGFNPDNGISFDPLANAGTEYAFSRTPTGTNLFDAAQAEAMVRFMIDGLPTSRDRGELVAADTTAMLTIADVRKALQPYVKLAIAARAAPDFSICGIFFDPKAEEYTSATVGELRAVIRAAGVWTDEMQAPAQDEESAEKPEAASAPPPPAEGDAADLCPDCGSAVFEPHKPDCQALPF